MVGHFINNELTSIDVNGNAETVYYVREADLRLIGVNKASGSRMRLMVKDSKIERIIYFDKPTGNMFPDKDVPPEQRMLKGFNWRFTSRPLQKEDVLRNVDGKLYQEAKEKAKEAAKEPIIEPVKAPAKDESKGPVKVIKPIKDQDIK